jgi:hypothetical protein
MDKKPNVFPSMNEGMKEANEMGTRIAEQANKELDIKNVHKSQGELDATAKMKQDSLDKLAEQLRLRDEAIIRNRDEVKGVVSENVIQAKPQVSYPSQETVETPQVEISEEEIYKRLSTPQENDHYDVIPLPSEGLLYKNGKSTLKVAYLNASDENIITNPNLLESGKFLEILINRKMLDTPLRYKDLHVGDRNAIMIWLRSTGYGPMYNITLSDPNAAEYTEFEAEVDLSKLGFKNLGVKPDKDCLFTYTLPVSGDEIKFRMLTVGDVEDIEEHLESILETEGAQFTDASTYSLKKQIIEVNGNRDSQVVHQYINRMRIGDVRKFRNYVNEIESGVNMNIVVGTPGGGSVDTFLPLNLTFFWPDLGI